MNALQAELLERELAAGHRVVVLSLRGSYIYERVDGVTVKTLLPEEARPATDAAPESARADGHG